MLRSKSYISSSEDIYKNYQHKNYKKKDLYLVKDLDFSFDTDRSKIRFSRSRCLYAPLINNTNKFSSKIK